MIRSATPADAEAIRDIYNYYIQYSISTFELEPLSKDEVVRRIERVTQKFPWIVFEDKSNIAGYAYADEWKTRKAYAFSVESTVYLKKAYFGRGIGSELYLFLIKELRKRNIHAVIAGISLPNKASVSLHEKLGFKKIARFREVGYKFNKWIDVGYWELIL